MEALVAARRRHREWSLRHAAAYDCELQEVADKLFIGSIGGVVNSGVLERNDITHVLCVSTGVKEDMLKKKAPDASVSVERLDDSSNDPQVLLQALPALLGFIAAVIAEGHSILVCSFRGRSRSAAVLIAHLMLVFNISLQEAAAHVARVRDSAVPNPGFIAALWALEAAITADCSVDSVATGLSEDEYSTKLLALAQVALSVLPGIIGDKPLPRSLTLADGSTLALSEGLDDLSLQALEEEATSFEHKLSATARTSSSNTSVGVDTMGARKGSPPDDAADEDASGEAVAENSVAALEARKADAVARNDFAEASRLRDEIRTLKASVGRELPKTAEKKAGPSLNRHGCELLVRKQELLARKQEAVAREDWVEAAKLRDVLRDLDKGEFQGIDVDSVSAASDNLEKQLTEAKNVDLGGLSTARSNLEKQLNEAKLNLTRTFHEELKEDLQGPEDAPSAPSETPLKKEALSFCQKCLMYPVVSLSIVLVTLMCIHAGLLHMTSKRKPKEL